MKQKDIKRLIYLYNKYCQGEAYDIEQDEIQIDGKIKKAKKAVQIMKKELLKVGVEFE